MYRNRLHHLRRCGAAVMAVFLFLGIGVLPLEAKKAPAQPPAAESTNFTFDTNAYNADMTTDRRGEGGSVILSLLSSLVIIAVIAVGLYYFLKFIARKQNQGNVNREIIRVIAQNSIAVGKYLTVVKIVNTYYILGLAEGGVTLIREVADRIEIDRLRELETQMPQPGAGAASFQDYLKDVFSRLRKPDRTAGARATPDRILGFLNTQKERLKKMNGGDSGPGNKGNPGGGKS